LTYGLILAVAMNFLSYFFSEKIALMSAQAQPLSQTQHPQVFARLSPIAGGLSRRMGIPMPKLWVTPEPSPKALATRPNPNHASVAVTRRHPATDE
jgi:heat shock protein HtpX